MLVFFFLLGSLSAAAEEPGPVPCLSELHAEFPGLSVDFLRSYVAAIALHAPTIWIQEESGQSCVSYAGKLDTGARPQVLVHLPPTECGHQWVKLSAAGEIESQGTYLFHPLSHFSVKDLIPEIMGLKAGEVVPPEVYRKYDSRRIALTLVYKKHLESEPGTSDGYLDSGRVQMMLNHRIMDSVASKGFLNQHQIKAPPGPGVYAPLARANAEDWYVGVTLAAKSDIGDTEDPAVNSVLNQVRPKYSLLDLASDPEHHPLTHSPQGSFDDMYYGDVAAVFNPDVNDRTTYSLGDSLGGSTVRSLRGDSSSDQARIFIEGQVWGELTLKDVHHFIVNCPKPYPHLSAEEIAKLKSFGKPVYECRPITAERPADMRPWSIKDDGPADWDEHWQEKVIRYGEGREL
ncbi:MAG: hypothetical protein ACXVCK_06920 [Bdellovibrionota bacterium]